METLVKDKAPPPPKTATRITAHPATGRDVVAHIPDPREEIDELLRIKASHRFDNNQVPCPSCNVPVAIGINRCPVCESDIAAETALARETTRRLRELSGELDKEHAERTVEKPKRRGFFSRLRYLFEGDPEQDPAEAVIDPHARRVLNLLTPGDTLKVLAEDGPWLQVKTMAGDIGWVYSTVRKRP